VEEYTRDFKKLLIKCDLQEAEEQTIVRYLGGLDPKYAQVVELQSFSTFDEVCVLAHKVETQIKSCPIKRDFSRPLSKSQPLARGVQPILPNPQIHPLPSHKRTKPLKEINLHQTGLISDP